MNTKIILEKAKDKDLARHCLRVGELALELADKLGINENTKKQVYISGLMHDIGKIRLDQQILNKEEKLSKEEFEHIKAHVYYSVVEAKKMGVSNFIIKSIYHHHENFDGTGYPEGLKGNEINIGARILKVCDYFDALSSDRPYRKALGVLESIEVMEQHNNEFDSQIYTQFKDIILNKQIGAKI